MGELLIHTEHISNLAATNTDVACGHVLIRTDVTIKLGHESLAEAHHFALALATGREVGTTLGSTHWQCGKRILECLLECKELEDSEVNRLVETDTALVRTDNVVVLDAITHVGLHLALVVNPCYSEFNHAIGDAKTLYQV